LLARSSIQKESSFSGEDFVEMLTLYPSARRTAKRFLDRMPEYEIRGIKVNFPFEAYEVQKIYMERVIESLQEVRCAL
jgi:hypothetical protein